jgi:vacuolar-type H+-ATPase subunit E/Vma4
MEELVSTEALEREILADARKKAERTIRGVDDEVRRIASEGERRTAEAVAELARGYAERSERYRAEALARFPLERSRIKAAYVDARLREALEAYMSSLPAGRVAAITSASLAKARSFLSGKELRARWRSLGAEAAARILAEALPESVVVDSAEDRTLPAAGIVVEVADGSATMRATLDLVAEAVLGERRGELASALCGKALAI